MGWIHRTERVGLRIVLFEACSAFTRVTACTLALSPIRDTHSEGFSYFVTSIAAPAASCWSDCRVGLAPTGKRRLVTAHTLNGHSVGIYEVQERFSIRAELQTFRLGCLETLIYLKPSSDQHRKLAGRCLAVPASRGLGDKVHNRV
jgi:hypothetical protein